MMTTAKRLAAKFREDRGQAIILFVGIFTVIMVIGAIAVDFGLWVSERRGAYKDADATSLAGIQAYLGELAADSLDDPDRDQACHEGALWAEENGVDPVGHACVPDCPADSCVDSGLNDCHEEGTDQMPWVEAKIRHKSRALFASIFGLGAPDIGAISRACAGSITGFEGVVPIELSLTNDPCFVNGQPVFTALCLLEAGACEDTGQPAASGRLTALGHQPNHNPPGQATDTPTPTDTPGPSPTPTATPTPGPGADCNPRGLLDLQADDDYCSDARGSPSYQELVDMIADGVNGKCLVNEEEPPACDPDRNGPWYECVAVQDGNTSAVIDGFRVRLDRQGPCDDDPTDGIEEFGEVVVLVTDTGDPTTSLYAPRDCGDGVISSRIITVIVLGEEPGAGNIGHPIEALAGFYFGGCYDNRAEEPPEDFEDLDQNCENIPEGQIAIYGQFVRLTLTNAEIGDPNDASTLFGIELVK